MLQSEHMDFNEQKLRVMKDKVRIGFRIGNWKTPFVYFDGRGSYISRKRGIRHCPKTSYQR